MTENEATNMPRSPGFDMVLLIAACFVLIAGLIYRGFYFMELSGVICYEIEASARMLAGQIPFQDFYFDQPLFIAYLRMPPVILAAALSGHGISQFAAIIPFWAKALASFITTALLAVLSFALSTQIIRRARISPLASRCLWASLVGFGLANFAMGFEFGCGQHIFCLLFTPYLILRVAHWSGDRASLIMCAVCGTLAGLGAAINPLFLAAVLFVELIEMISRGFCKAKPPLEFLTFAIAFSLSSAWIFCLSDAARAVLDDWIIPLKLTTLHLEQIAYFGLGSSPDRRPTLYLCTAVMVASFGLISRIPQLRPLCTATMCGLAAYLVTMTGLSSELVILTWFMTLTLTVLVVYAIYCSVLTSAVRRYPTLSYKASRFVGVRACLIAVFCLVSLTIMVAMETSQRRENITVVTGPVALDPTLIDVEDALLKYSHPGDKVLILNSRLLPTFPLYSRINRQIAGYFINTEPLSTLANIESHHLPDQKLNKPFGWLVESKKKIYKRIGLDIQAQRPAVIAVEGGLTYDSLRDTGVLRLIEKDYKQISEARYHSWCSGAKEFADWNYRYNIYCRK